MLRKLHKQTRGISNDAIMRIAQEVEDYVEKEAQSMEKNWDLYTLLEETLGPEELAMNIAKGLSSDELNSSLEYIAQMYDIGPEEDFDIEGSSKEAQEEGYQGWSNAPTWGVALILNNEYDLYQEMNQLAEQSQSVEELASGLQSLAEMNANPGSMMGQQLAQSDEDAPEEVLQAEISDALSQVNWMEIAEDALVE